jgi:hypothetical protein
LGPL